MIEDYSDCYPSGMAKIFIYGSCVSRDAYEQFKDRHRLLAYAARQSLVSAMAAPTDLLSGVALGSSFQNRMLEGDLGSNLLPTLRHHANSIDLLLMDLTDERLGVHKLPDNSFITHSSELVASKRLAQLSPVPGVIQVGTERHWGFWSRAADRFANRLDALGIKGRALVINTPWAETSFEGVPVPAYRGVPTSQMNEHLNKMAGHLRSLGLNVVDMPASLAVSTSKHKWGIDPFHYGEPAYSWIGEQVESALI